MDLGKNNKQDLRLPRRLRAGVLILQQGTPFSYLNSLTHAVLSRPMRGAGSRDERW
jgi:hypothetical protein